MAGGILMVMMGLLAIVIGLGSLACWLMVLIKLFQKEGVGLGILGIICGIYTFIWGWMNAKELGMQKLMMIWTALIVIGIPINIVIQLIAASANAS